MKKYGETRLKKGNTLGVLSRIDDKKKIEKPVNRSNKY